VDISHDVRGMDKEEDEIYPSQSLTEYCLCYICKTSSGLMTTVLHHRKLYVYSLRACPGPYAFTTMDWFGCSRSQLSIIFNDVVIFLFQRLRNKLFFDRRRLTQRRMEWFARAIERQGGGDRVWGWIDGTINRICRPTDDQRECYSGYKKAHGYKF
jgi:hypothetical protein